MEVKNNIMSFNTDDEFTDFCLCKDAISGIDDKTGIMYYDYPFTDEYLQAVNNGLKFNILDYDSKVMKRGCVNRGIITKRIKNLNL